MQCIAVNKLCITRTVHVFDDYFIIDPSSLEAILQLKRFLDFCDENGISIAPEKTEGPAQKMTFLGIMFCTCWLCYWRMSFRSIGCS